MILRPIQGHFEVVVEAYMTEIMHEEAMAVLEQEILHLQTFEQN